MLEIPDEQHIFVAPTDYAMGSIASLSHVNALQQSLRELEIEKERRQLN